MATVTGSSVSQRVQVWAEDYDGVQSVERGSKQVSYILQVSGS